MKRKEIVKLQALKNEYKTFNLNLESYGIVLLNENSMSKVLFLNNKIVGDYAIATIKDKDLVKFDGEIPDITLAEFDNYLKENIEKLKTKTSFADLVFNEYDSVELIVEKDRYSKYGIHKGETGVVAENYGVKKDILVDFTGVNKNGEVYGDCISVSKDDLKLVKKNIG